jgi:hypothetical protein
VIQWHLLSDVNITDSFQISINSLFIIISQHLNRPCAILTFSCWYRSLIFGRTLFRISSRNVTVSNELLVVFFRYVRTMSENKLQAFPCTLLSFTLHDNLSIEYNINGADQIALALTMFGTSIYEMENK